MSPIIYYGLIIFGIGFGIIALLIFFGICAGIVQMLIDEWHERKENDE